MKNIDTMRLLKKLDYKIIGPFKIIWETEGSYELDLLKLMARKHSVFHLLLLRRAEEDSLPEQVQQLQPLLIVKGNKQWEVNNILDARKKYGWVQFKAKWKGYPLRHLKNETWYDVSDFSEAKDVVEDFYKRYSRKPCWTPPLKDAEWREE